MFHFLTLKIIIIIIKISKTCTQNAEDYTFDFSARVWADLTEKMDLNVELLYF